MKLLLQPTSYEQMVANQAAVTGFIAGIDDLSVNVSFMCSDEELKKLMTQFADKEFFICLNKNYQNHDLPVLEKLLSKLKVTGILFYDLAIVHLNNQLNLQHNLIWHAEHFTTSFYPFAVLNDYQVKGMVLSLDMHYQEMIKISEEVNGITMLPVFGYYPIFNSIRHLASNYFTYFKQPKDISNLSLAVNDVRLPIIEEKNNTTILTSFLVDGSAIIKKLNKIDYGIVNGYQVDSKFLSVVFEKLKKQESLKGMADNLSDEIFYQQTTYRIKGDRK